jgi:UDP-N-acetylmuramyl tripeptide synthase
MNRILERGLKENIMATATLRPTQPTARTAILASADLSFRQRVRDALAGLRWQVREASGGAEALAHLDSAPADNLIADFASGTPSATSVTDLTNLNTALNYVSQQRVTLDDSITRLTAAANYNTSESTQLQSVQDNLLQANTAQVATELSSAETQQSALTQVIAAIDQQGTLFNQLQ